jgi:hypothetical protein
MVNIRWTAAQMWALNPVARIKASMRDRLIESRDIE